MEPQENIPSDQVLGILKDFQTDGTIELKQEGQPILLLDYNDDDTWSITTER